MLLNVTNEKKGTNNVQWSNIYYVKKKSLVIISPFFGRNSELRKRLKLWNFEINCCWFQFSISLLCTRMTGWKTVVTSPTHDMRPKFLFCLSSLALSFRCSFHWLWAHFIQLHADNDKKSDVRSHCVCHDLAIWIAQVSVRSCSEMRKQRIKFKLQFKFFNSITMPEYSGIWLGKS